MKTSDFRKILNTRWIGYDPDRMKSVHIANGLYLQTLGKQYAAETVNKIAVIAGRKGPIKAHGTELLLRELSDKVDANEGTFNLYRQHLREHLGADGAIFDRQVNAGCAYSAATSRLVTDDRHNDGWSGNFIGHILSLDFGEGISPVIASLCDALEDDQDALTTLLSPFLSDEGEATPFDASYGGLEAENFSELIANSPDTLLLRKGMESLASYYPDYLSKERFTRLLIILSTFTLLRHIITLAQTHLHIDRIPFILDAMQRNSTRMRLASQSSYIRCQNALTDLYAFFISEYICEIALGRDEEINLKTVLSACDELNKELGEELLKKAPIPLERNFSSVEELLGFASQHITTQLFEKSNFMEGFFRDVGIRCGLLMPRGQYPKKHFYLQPDTLEAIVLACVRPDEPPLTMGQFAKRLWNNFGLIVGGQPDDIEILAYAGIRELNQDDLDLNHASFTQIMVSLGLAQLRSDGLVLIRPTWK